MNSSTRRPLYKRYPKRIDVPAGILISAATIIAGLSLPVMSITKLIFWEDSYTIIVGAYNLVMEGYHFIGILIFVFSVIFPNVKLLGLLAIWFAPIAEGPRTRAVWWLSVLGKWSMLDVFVVAVVIVLSSSRALGDVSPRIGLYIFAAGVLMSMIVSVEVERLARKSSG